MKQKFNQDTFALKKMEKKEIVDIDMVVTTQKWSAHSSPGQTGHVLRYKNVGSQNISTYNQQKESKS